MTIIFVTKLLLETQSPMAINTGDREKGFDSQLTRDVNGLPYIPATAIAGVWSHLTKELLSKEMQNKWFGTTEQASSLVISNAILHDSNNIPVSPLMQPNEIENDPLLKFLSYERPHHRERVSINDRSVAKETGKFDQIILPKGVRFSLTLKWTTQYRDDNKELNNDEWHDLLSLLNDRMFTLGSNSRNGLGQIKIKACEQNEFDLAGNKGMSHSKALQSFIRKSHLVKNDIPQRENSQAIKLASLPLQALDNWRCGSGDTLLGENYNTNNISLITYSEPCIEWNNNNKALIIKNKPILCGSSIKGILAHRIAYHLRRRTNEWAENMADDNHEKWQQTHPKLKELFGSATDNKNNDAGQAGYLYIDDAVITYEKTVLRTHNKIDRFTGGVQQGALFSEELLYQPKFTLNIWLSKKISISEPLRNAIKDTISDLKIGLLPMGSGSGRGTSLVMPQKDAKWKCNIDKIYPVSEQGVTNK